MPQTTHRSGPAGLNELLAEPLRVGEPNVSGPLAVYPIFGPAPDQEYLAFAVGRERGVKVHELEGGASVNDLVIENPTDTPVLLYAGQEILGAQQNRVFERTVLVQAKAKAVVPVTCVEQGRWDHTRHQEAFDVAPQAAYPRFRRLATMRAHKNRAAGRAARSHQGEMWDEVSAKAARLDAGSPTGAIHDVYEGRRDRLTRICDSIPLHDGQVGAIGAFGGQLDVLDYVSRADVFAAMHRPLVQGYALDAIEAGDAEPPLIEAASGFALLVADSPPADREPSAGLGEEILFAANGVAGTALAVDDELVQLTAFPGDDQEWSRERMIPAS